MITRFMLVLGRWCKRHKFVVAMLGLIVAIAYVPMFPYFPDCDEYPYAVYKIHLSDRYRVELTKRLVLFGVSHLVIGDVVLLRFSDWVDDSEDWILNASDKAVWTLVDREFNPWLKDPPDPIKALTEAARNPRTGDIELTCELVRAVAIEEW